MSDEKLDLSIIQKKVDEWIQNHGGYWPPLSMLAAVIEEMGELSREINHLEGYKPKKVQTSSYNIGEELADIIFTLTCLANHYKIDLEREFLKIMDKYTKRDSKRFS
jgi:NTP pyrophosphatase (non-canonical NTP hydrolase)